MGSGADSWVPERRGKCGRAQLRSRPTRIGPTPIRSTCPVAANVSRETETALGRLCRGRFVGHGSAGQRQVGLPAGRATPAGTKCQRVWTLTFTATSPGEIGVSAGAPAISARIIGIGGG